MANPAEATADFELRFSSILVVCLKHPRAFLAIPSAMVALVLGLVVFLPKHYTTVASFTPSTLSASPAQLTALAAQFGVSLGGEAAQSPAFYGNLIGTPTILLDIVNGSYEVRQGGESTTQAFADLYDLKEDEPGKTTTEALRYFKKHIMSVDVDNPTSLITVSIRTEWREMSFDIANRLLVRLNEFNLQSHRTEAGQQLRFLTERVDTAAADLHRAETGLEDFLKKNRSYENDPTLQFQHDRLQREVSLRQDVYNMLVQGREQARVEAVRNTPSITIVQAPERALTYDRRHVLLKLTAALLGGLIAAVAWSVFVEMTSEIPTVPGSTRMEVRSALLEARRDLARLKFRSAGRG